MAVDDTELLEVLERRPMASQAERVWGNLVYWEDDELFWDDTEELCVLEPRPCPSCGELPVWCELCQDYHDACLGHKSGFSSLCCGHGRPCDSAAVMRYDLEP